jgi:hypothetical protein
MVLLPYYTIMACYGNTALTVGMTRNDKERSK